MSSRKESEGFWRRIPWGWRLALSLSLLPVAVAVLGVAEILFDPFPDAPSSTGSTSSPDSSFTPQMVLRYQTPASQFALLEISPFEVGNNTFRVTVLDENEEPVDAGDVTLAFSSPDRQDAPIAVEAVPGPDRASRWANYALAETGWWAIAVGVDGEEAASFYLRLDDPSQAPLEVAPPDYESDPAAEALFGKTLTRFEGLSSARWHEQLTSGLEAPIGTGVAVVTDGAAVAPDRTYFRTVSPAGSNELYRIGETRCSQFGGEPWQCSTGRTSDPFARGYLEPATAFRLGRSEVVDEEMTRVLLFYNPAQRAWYAWWVSEETGHLLRRAMVAPGHFMVTRYFDHNEPITIQFPEEVLVSVLDR